MQFERFHWLSHHSIWAILPWSTKIASAWFFWAFLFLLKSSFLYFGAFFNRTRRLAACTQAVIILRSTNFIAIQLKCSAFEVVRNSIESMCLSYSAFYCISWNRLIACYSFTDLLKARKMSQDRYISLWTFQSIFVSLCRCLFVCFSFLK